MEQKHRSRSEVVSNLVLQVAKKLKDKRQKRTMEEIFKKVTKPKHFLHKMDGLLHNFLLIELYRNDL